jgi:hypothetical protein
MSLGTEMQARRVERSANTMCQVALSRGYAPASKFELGDPIMGEASLRFQGFEFLASLCWVGNHFLAHSLTLVPS